MTDPVDLDALERRIQALPRYAGQWREADVDTVIELIAWWRAQKPVHHVGYASQPDVRFYCGVETQAGWNQPKDLPPSVHLADNGERYTFDVELTTCVACWQAQCDMAREAETEAEVIRHPLLKAINLYEHAAAARRRRRERIEPTAGPRGARR